MASNIDSTSIDATFPVAGQDNDSQGLETTSILLRTILQRLRVKLKHFKLIPLN